MRQLIRPYSSSQGVIVDNIPKPQIPYAPDLSPLARRLANLGDLAWLTSGASGGARRGRYDILTAAPSQHIRYGGGTLQIGSVHIRTKQPFEVLAAALPMGRARASSRTSSFPFEGGFIGYLGYPLHAQCERQAPAPPDPTGMPALVGAYYPWALVADHRAKRVEWVGAPPPPEAVAAVNAPLAATTPAATFPAAGTPGYALTGPFESSMSEPAYREAFATVQDHIRAGDCYQVNLARHYSAPCVGDAVSLLRDFQRLQDARFSALLCSEHGAVISVSPERFVRARSGRVSTWPIKGTAPRAARRQEDLANAAALRESTKDRAENVMIVDLLRNDLGRVCQTGSVQVDALCHLRSHPNVHHLQSVISGELVHGTSPWSALAALFPCGSITGAPKIKAIDIINALEPVGRSAYCGAIGYIDAASGDFDFNVAIRTAVLSSERLHLWGGGGLVADSEVDRELREIDHKIGRLLRGLYQLR